MIHAISPSTVFRAAFTLTFGLALIAYMTSSPQTAGEFMRMGSVVLGLASAILILLTIKPVLRFVHRATFGDVWWFPWLDGNWEGEIRSNWPVIKAMMDAAKGDATPFDALSQLPPAGAAIQTHKVQVTIESGLFDIQIALVVPDTTNQSHSLFARPERHAGQPPRLYYVYKQTSNDPLPISDVRVHLGAACLDYDKQNDELRGDYWTNRNRERGLNTAGSITLKRVSKRPSRRRKRPTT